MLYSNQLNWPYQLNWNRLPFLSTENESFFGWKGPNPFFKQLNSLFCTLDRVSCVSCFRWSCKKTRVSSQPPTNRQSGLAQRSDFSVSTEDVYNKRVDRWTWWFWLLGYLTVTSLSSDSKDWQSIYFSLSNSFSSLLSVPWNFFTTWSGWSLSKKDVICPRLDSYVSFFVDSNYTTAPPIYNSNIEKKLIF